MRILPSPPCIETESYTPLFAPQSLSHGIKSYESGLKDSAGI